MTTYENIISSFKDFCLNHPLINDFGSGDIANLQTKEHEFPFIWIMPNGGNKNGSLTSLTFDIYITDVLEQNRSNITDVLSNTLIIGNSIISEFWEDDTNNGFELDETSISLSPFEGDFDALLGGWIYNVKIDFKMSINCSNL